MSHTIRSISENMEEVFCGNPWYGKSVLTLLNEIDPSIVYIKPGGQGHSIIELLYHMLTWEEFTLHHLESMMLEPEKYQLLDWRETNPEIHTWNAGVSELKATHNKIINILQNASDDLLASKVPYKDYNTAVLLNGLIEHNIYHIGQIAMVKKMLS